MPAAAAVMMMMVVMVSLLFRPPLLFGQRLLNLLLLFVDEELLHRVIVVVVLNEQLKLPLLLQHRPLLFSPRFLFFLVIIILCILLVAAQSPLGALPAQHVLPADAALVGVVVVARLVARVVDADQPAADLGAAQVVDGQVGAALVLVLEPAEALGLARLLVAHQLEEDGLAELAEDGDDVALGQLVGEAAEVDEGRVAVVDVPGRVRGDAIFDLALVERLDRSDLVHG